MIQEGFEESNKGFAEGNSNNARPRRKLPKLLPVLGWICIGVALGHQLARILRAWFEYDSRFSCDRLTQWGEWISCLHETSHAYIGGTEAALAIWAFVGLSARLMRSRSLYVAALIPVIVIAVFILSAIDDWNRNFAVLLDITPAQKLEFIVGACIFFGCFGLPFVGACLLGLHARLQCKAREKVPGPFEPAHL